MKRILAAAAAAAATMLLASSSAAKAGGTVERIEVTSVTRDVAALWIRATLPAAAAGERLVFSGTIAAGGIRLPLRSPVSVALQGRGPVQALFASDVDLARLPEGILSLAGSRGDAVAVEINGSLSDGKGATTPVVARGRLRPSAPDFVAPASAVASFALFSGARLAGLSLKKAEGEATVSVFNPAGFDLLVEEIRYELFVGGRLLFSGARRGVRLHARRANEVTLPLDVRHADLLAAAGNAVVSGGTVAARLVASVTVKAGSGKVTVPVDQAGKVRFSP